MILLVLYLALALGVSFLCSILEAVLLSITPTYVEAQQRKASATGGLLRRLKGNIEQPLAAILSLNTIAHTVGAAGVGAQALVVFGDAYVAVVSGILTLLILVFSEIIPKTIGAFYWQQLAGISARILLGLIWIMYPLVVMSEKIADWMAPEEGRGMTVSREELRAMAVLASQQGIFSQQESQILRNLFRAGKLRATDFMTPRTVLFMLPQTTTVEEVLQKHPELRFTRIPIYDENPDDVKGFVLRKDIILEAARQAVDTNLADLRMDLKAVPENITLISLLETFLDQREHIVLVVDEYGGVAGVVTMEDVVETLLDIEIVDETDETVDMQALARRKWERRAESMGLEPPASDKSDKKSPEGEQRESTVESR